MKKWLSDRGHAIAAVFSMKGHNDRNDDIKPYLISSCV